MRRKEVAIKDEWWLAKKRIVVEEEGCCSRGRELVLRKSSDKRRGVL